MEVTIQGTHIQIAEDCLTDDTVYVCRSLHKKYIKVSNDATGRMKGSRVINKNGVSKISMPSALSKFRGNKVFLSDHNSGDYRLMDDGVAILDPIRFSLNEEDVQDYVSMHGDDCGTLYISSGLVMGVFCDPKKIVMSTRRVYGEMWKDGVFDFEFVDNCEKDNVSMYGVRIAHDDKSSHDNVYSVKMGAHIVSSIRSGNHRTPSLLGEIVSKRRGYIRMRYWRE